MGSELSSLAGCSVPPLGSSTIADLARSTSARQLNVAAWTGVGYLNPKSSSLVKSQDGVAVHVKDGTLSPEFNGSDAIAESISSLICLAPA